MNNRENEEFTQQLRDAVRQAEELRYFPHRFKAMLEADGGFETVKRILASGKPSEGFEKLWELHRVDLTCEAIIVETKWRRFFDDDLLAKAEKLLRGVNYLFKRFESPESDADQPKHSTSNEEYLASPGLDDRKILNRKKFLESQGATCRNWTWSWSFINEAERTIIFGAWDKNSAGNRALILSEEWEISRRGRKQPGYTQAREHIRLIEEEGFNLKTFPMVYSQIEEEGDVGPAKIEDFVAELTTKTLVRVGGCWYASDDELAATFPEEVENGETFVEGAAKTVRVNSYERNPSARAKCLAHHGYACTVCLFNFESVYGALGRNYIHVHHVIALSDVRREYIVDPINDLVPVCPNCHAMIHVTRPYLTVEQLRSHLLASK